MAKYRNRIFEMYEFRDEAIRALMPKSGKTATEATTPELSTFVYLAVSRSADLTHVQFKAAKTCGEETASALREDFVLLSDRLDRDSKVLLDFTGVVSFGTASIEALILLNKHLRHRGSRVVLCSLSPAVRECFCRHPFAPNL